VFSLTLANAHVNLHTGIAEPGDPAPGYLRIGIDHGDYYATDPRSQNSVNTWGSFALVAARLKRHVHRRAGYIRPRPFCSGDSINFGMRTTEPLVKSAGQFHLLAGYHSAHHRIGLNGASSGGGDLQGDIHKVFVTISHGRIIEISVQMARRDDSMNGAHRPDKRSFIK
jgi:hypothetical protein